MFANLVLTTRLANIFAEEIIYCRYTKPPCQLPELMLADDHPDVVKWLRMNERRSYSDGSFGRNRSG